MASLTLIKLSALFQYLRFIKLGRLRTFCWVMVCVMAIWGVANLFVDIFSCIPVGFISLWKFELPGEHCIYLPTYFYFGAIFTIATDFIVVAIPMFVIKDLKIPLRQKAALVLVFALGGLYDRNCVSCMN